MEVIHTLISWVLWIAGLVSIVASFVLMGKVKATVPDGQQDQSPLTPNEKNYVLLMSVFSPVIVSSIFYYGWKKKLPVKAKSANNWGWLGLLIAIIIWIGISFI